MSIERWTMTRDGVTQSFWAEVDVVANFVEPCPYCGVPCTGTFRVWYVDGNRRVTFETDRGSLDGPLEQLVGAACERDEYNALPTFVRDWNEHTGWHGAGLDGGEVVAANDLLRAVDILDLYRLDDNRMGKLLAALRDVVMGAVQEGLDVWAGRT